MEMEGTSAKCRKKKTIFSCVQYYVTDKMDKHQPGKSFLMNSPRRQGKPTSFWTKQSRMRQGEPIRKLYSQRQEAFYASQEKSNTTWCDLEKAKTMMEAI